VESRQLICVLGSNFGADLESGFAGASGRVSTK